MNEMTEYDNSHHYLPMHGDQDRAKKVKRRLKTIEGHVRGIQKMVDDGAPCLDIMRQIKAVTSALEKVNALALEGHVDICIQHGLLTEHPDARQRAFIEIRQAFNVLGKL